MASTRAGLLWLLVGTLGTATLGIRNEDHAAEGRGNALAAAGARAESGTEVAAGSILQGRYRLVSKLADWPKVLGLPLVMDERYHKMGDEELGLGTFGETWLAFDMVEWRQVAVKFLTQTDRKRGIRYPMVWDEWKKDGGSRYLVMAEQECKSTQKISRDGSEKGRSRIAKCLDNQIRHGWVAHLVLELAGTQELFDVINRLVTKNKHPAPDFVLRIARMLLEALQQLEQTNFTHLDIKPENIMLYKGHADQKTYLRIIDFGFALPYGSSIQGLRGSPEYMAPEMFANAYSRRKTRADFKIDVFSAGVVLHLLMCGENVYDRLLDAGVERADLADSYSKHWERTLCKESAVQPELRELLKLVKQHMLQPDPSKRLLASALLEDPVLVGLDIPPCRPREPFAVGEDVTDTFKDGEVFRKHGRNKADRGKCCCPEEGECLAVPDSVLLKKCYMRGLFKSTISCENCMPTEGMINVEKKAAATNSSQLRCWTIHPSLGS